MRVLRWLKRGMISCRKAQELSSLGLDRPLTLKERLALWSHLFMCATCRFYFKEMRRLHRLIHLLNTKWPDGVWKTLPGLRPEQKQRLTVRLRQIGRSDESSSNETKPPKPPPPH